MESPRNKTLLIGERMIILLECSNEEKLTSYLLWIVMADLGVLIIVWLDMINDIPAKISQPSFGTTKTVKSNGGISSQFK